MLCIVAIADCTHVVSAIVYFKDLIIILQDNTTNQTADVLLEDQLKPPLDLVTGSQEREVHESNSRTEHGSVVAL